MLQVLKDKNFFLLFQGAFVSEFGNMLYNLAMTFFVYDITGESELAMAIYLGISVLVRALLSPVAGVLVDKWNKVRVIYATDFIRGFVFLGFLYILYTGLFQDQMLWVIYIATILSSICAAFFFPAVGSGIPEIVGEEKLQQAQSAQGFLMSFPAIIGSLFGAALYDMLGIEIIVTINAITFIVSGITELFIRTPYKTEHKDNSLHEESIMKNYMDSLRYAKKIKVLNLILFFLVINFAFTPLISVGTPVLFRSILARENTMEYAITGAVFSAGMMVASILIGNKKLESYKKGIPKAVTRMTVLFFITSLLFHAVASGWIGYWVFYGGYLVLAVLFAFNMIAINVPINIGITLSVEPEMRGRVFSTIGALSQFAVPFAMVFGGIILEYSTISVLGLLCSLLLLIPTFGFKRNKAVNELLSTLDDRMTEQN